MQKNLEEEKEAIEVIYGSYYIVVFSENKSSDEKVKENWRKQKYKVVLKNLLLKRKETSQLDRSLGSGHWCCPLGL